MEGLIRNRNTGTHKRVSKLKSLKLKSKEGTECHRGFRALGENTCYNNLLDWEKRKNVTKD